MLSRTDYKRVNADPKRSEAAQKAAAVRQRREQLHADLYQSITGITNPMEIYRAMAELARAKGGAYLELLGTQWLPGTKKEK